MKNDYSHSESHEKMHEQGNQVENTVNFGHKQLN